jgi:MFS family permease
VGYTLGGALGGILTAPLIVNFGWQSAFLADGFASLAVAVLLFFMLPESARFLAVQGGRERELASIMRRLRPDLAVDASSRFTVAEHGAERGMQISLHRRPRFDYLAALDRLHPKSDGALFSDELATDSA